MESRVSLLILLILTQLVWADEGMWLYNEPPSELLKSRYEFEPSPSWLEHLQKSSVRFNNGGSGSFVSSQGLVMTNHHVGADAIHKLSSEGQNLVEQGFLATNRAQELKTPDLELNVLVSIEDVTAEVQAAVGPEMEPDEAEKARRAVMNTLENESLEKTGLRSDVVTLFRGGQYHLYRYRRFTDVRLVFAPEIGIAFFGGDSDNFEYPRYCLDVAFFRVYEDGQPYRPDHYLEWSSTGVKPGDLIFVSGHPGRTERLNTAAHLEYLRDVRYPTALRVIRRLEVLLKTYGERSQENKRQAQDSLFGYQNARKAYLGGLAGLQNPELVKTKRQQEKKLRQALAEKPDLAQQVGDPWAEVAEAVKELETIYQDYYLLEQGRAFNSQLFSLARSFVRLAEEKEKPNPERLREFRESALASLEQQLTSPAPIFPELEARKLADSLSMWVEWKGFDHPLTQAILEGQSPSQRAFSLINSSRLADPDYRAELWSGGPQAIRASQDPMLELARLVDQPSRALRERYSQKVEGPLETAYGKLARILYETGAKELYPDATFTLRLAFGVVRGYQDNGVELAPLTTIGGLYERSAEQDSQKPFKIPERWVKARPELNLETPFNFVSTPDITGGNSGSPVVNRAGEVVGLIFDGNIHSLVIDFLYSETQARAISVDARAIVEALTKVYKAEGLVTEITGT